MKKLVLGVFGGTALAMMCSQADAQIAIAADFAFLNPANSIRTNFQFYYSVLHNPRVTYGNAALVSASSATIENGIINVSYHVDLFIASSPQQVNDLIANHPGLVVGAPFAVAIDTLDLYSAADFFDGIPAVDISAGLPYPLTTQIVIANPATDNYGAAAAQILASRPWNIPTAKLIPNGFGFVSAVFDTSTAQAYTLTH
jgi:hypothetical protein